VIEELAGPVLVFAVPSINYLLIAKDTLHWQIVSE
jgi:hypothetical protein